MKRLFKRLTAYRNTDLTAVPVWKALVWLTIPALVGNAVQSTFNVIIMYFVSRLGTAAIAAVSVAGIVAMLVFTAIIGLSVGCTALVARYRGARDDVQLRRAIITTLAFSAALSVVMAAAGIIIGRPLLRLLGAAPDVVALAYSYLVVFFLGGCGLVFLNMVTAVLRGVGDAVTATALMALAVALDVLFEPVFIFGLGPAPALGVRGAALGAVCAFATASAVAFWVLRRRQLPPGSFKRRNVDGRMAGELVTIGVPASLQMLIRIVAQLVLVGFVAGGGTVAVAAFGVGNQLTALLLIPPFAFSMSAAILTGQNLGAGKTAQAERSAFVAAGTCAAIAAAMVLALVAFARPLVTLFDPTPRVVALGTLFLYICAPSYIVTPFGMVLSRAMGGAGVSVPPLIATAVVLLGVRIPLAYVLTNVAGLGPVGVFWAIAIPNALEGLAMTAVFKTGVWKRKKL